MQVETKKNCISLNIVSTALDISRSHIAWSEKNHAFIVELEKFDSDIVKQKILLEGHHRCITALKFAQIDGSSSLITASSDYVIIWHLDEVFNSFQQGEEIRGHILCSCVDSPHHIAFLQSRQLICCATDTCLFVINPTCTLNEKVIAKMEVNDQSCVEFFDEHCIISTSFKGHILAVDILSQEVIWEHIQTMNCSFTALTAGGLNDGFAIGSSVATILEFAFHEKQKKFKPCMKLDLEECMMHSQGHWKREGKSEQSGGQVIAMTYIERSTDEDLTEQSKDPPLLLCATERALFLINCSNKDIKVAGYFDEDIGPPVVGQVRFTSTELNNKVYCAAVGLLDPRLHFFTITLPERTHDLNLSLISSSPLLPKSPLNSQSKLVNPSKSTKDLPVTFKKTIKSSGYRSAPRMTMFKPNTSFSTKKSEVKLKPSSKNREVLSSLPAEEPCWDAIESEIFQVSSSQANVNCLTINDSNRSIAFAHGNLVHVGRLPLNTFISKSKVLSGHSQAVSGCFWSHDSNLLMTYSRNRDVMVWKLPFTNDSCLSFQAESDEKVGKELIHAQFYYLDKFLLLGVGDTISLRKYVLSDEKKDDVKRYLNKSKEKIVGKWKVSAQSLTCMLASNHFYSYIALACCSDRSIVVLDLNRNTQVHTFADAQSRPIHSIRCAMPSSTLSRDLFMTSATSDGIKLWDLRTQQCIKKFQQHPCSTKCEATISNCGNYVATATDNKSVFIYDVRMRFPLHEINEKWKAASLAFTSDSRQLLIGNDSSKIELVKACR